MTLIRSVSNLVLPQAPISYDQSSVQTILTDIERALQSIERRVSSSEETETVDSFNGRTGVVAPAASDYNASQIDNDSGVSGTFVDDALDTLDSGKADIAGDTFTGALAAQGDGSTNLTRGITSYRNSDDNVSASFGGLKSRGSFGSPSAVLSGDNLVNFNTAGYDGSSYGAGARMVGVTTENWSASAHGCLLRFFVIANGATAGTTALEIGQNGVSDFKFTPTVNSVALLTNSTGIAQGKHTIWIPAGAMTPRTTNGAAPGVTELATNDVMLNTLDFDQTTQEFAEVLIGIPKSWNESTLSFQPWWTAASGSGGVVWALEGRAYADEDTLDQAVGADQTSTDTFVSANKGHRGPESSALTLAGSASSGINLIRISIRRKVADASDTLTADAKLIGIDLFYTINASTDA